MDAANRHGLEVAVHAIGDAAVEQALKEFEETGATGSIEHAQLIGREDSPHDGAAGHPGERAAGAPARRPRPHRELLARPHRAVLRACAGCTTTGSRWCWAATPRSRRWTRGLAIAAAVHRSADDRDPWHPEQALTVAEALAASTNGLGTVAVGTPGRPRAARRRPAAGRVIGRAGAGAALDAGRRHLGGGPAWLTPRSEPPADGGTRPSAMVSSRMLRGSSSRSPKTSRSWPMR